MCVCVYEGNLNFYRISSHVFDVEAKDATEKCFLVKLNISFIISSAMLRQGFQGAKLHVRKVISN